MPLLSWTNIERHFGSVTILNGASGALEPGEKAALVGPNGAGKTTLLKMLANIGDKPDGGAIALARGSSVGYLPQRPEPPPGMTLRAWVLGAFDHLHAIEKELEGVHDELATAKGDALERLMLKQDELQSELERRGGYETERRTNAVLSGLGFREDQLDTEAARLSGGEKSRGALARILCEEPDLLLLDEPTNHLDLDMLDWLESWLKGKREAVIVVSHDRYFLDRVVDKVIAMERGKCVEYPGNYSDYCLLRDERATRAAKERKEHTAYVEKQKEYIRRFKAGQRARQATGREKQLQTLIEQKGEQGPQGPQLGSGRTLAFDFHKIRRAGDHVLRVKGLGYRYEKAADKSENPQLFSDLDLEIERGDRVGVIGPNGSGKTTFLRVIAGEMKSQVGEVKLGAAVDAGYFRQESEDLSPEKSILDEVHDASPREDLVVIRSICGRFGFTDDEQLKKIKALSGGERARVMLAKLFLKRPNFLILDEPTNHLDLEARESLEEALFEYTGTILTVSHDRYFLDRIATRILAFGEENPPKAILGDYTTYRDRKDAAVKDRKRQAEEREKSEKDRDRKKAAQAPKPSAPAPSQQPAKPQQKPAGAAKSGNQKVKKKHSFAELEKKIEETEAKVKQIETTLAAPEMARDFAKMKTLSGDLEKSQRELRELNQEWEAWAEEMS